MVNAGEGVAEGGVAEAVISVDVGVKGEGVWGEAMDGLIVVNFRVRVSSIRSRK